MKGFYLLLELSKEAVEKEGLINKDPFMVSESLWALIHGISALFIKFNTFIGDTKKNW
ncbi:hypothetical protein [Alteribacillus sp. HJP-4]|uniref:hypothetical protein n=1 Tax=Alteribacillus sp. HJP-4 TaxID=2775394 RepID=UPI0035CCE63D